MDQINMQAGATNSEKVKKTIQNLFYAFAAQGISLILSMIMSLIVPKTLGITEFSYWQLFLFYVSYSGFFHLGFNDGLYLKYGGTDYGQLNHALIGSQFRVSLGMQFIFASCILLYAHLFVDDDPRKFVLTATCIYILLYNAIAFFGYVFQATNRIVNFSLSVVIDKICFIGFIILLLIFKVRYFQAFIILFLVSKGFGLTYSLYVGRKIAFARFLNFTLAFKEMFANISIGIKLMISNIASGLILGIGRFAIDRSWGITSFGKLSFALSLTGFFLIFIYQVSIVLFPVLRKIDIDQQKKFYLLSRNLLGVILSSILLFYLPINYILNLWLPKYSESLRYLVILLPLCLYDGKLEMLCSTYLKVLRMERLLLSINIITLIISVILCGISAFIFKNIYFVVVSMVIAVGIRSLIAELYISKLMEISSVKNLLAENILALGFVILTWFLTPLYAFVIFFFLYLTYLFIMKKELNDALITTKTFLKR